MTVVVPLLSRIPASIQGVASSNFYPTECHERLMRNYEDQVYLSAS